jgi:hypothetical protein
MPEEWNNIYGWMNYEISYKDIRNVNVNMKRLTILNKIIIKLNKNNL